MAIITLNKKQFEKEIGKLDEKMQNKIAMFGTTVEGFNDKEIEIEVFPNRPDMLSYQGFKRSFLSFLGKTSGLKKYKIYKPEKDYKIKIDSSVKNVRPYTACAIVKGLHLDDEKIKEIIEIQEKLHTTIGRKRKKVAIGIYPLEKIKLPIIYKAIEPDKIKFIPLETQKEMSGLQILQRHPAGKEYAHLLAGKIKFPIFIDANKNILSMPPIINSKSTGKITEKTKDVFVECSGFDFYTLNKCLEIIVTTLSEMGGKIYQMELGYPKKQTTPNLKSEKMKLSLNNTNKLLGLDLNEKQLKKLIEKMGHDYKKNYVETPAWRTDILHEVDLIEDVAIAYGYENFIPEIPQISTIGQENQKETIKRKISGILTGMSMIEISNYHLTNKNDQFKKMGLKTKDFIEVKESKTDYKILRENLAHYLLKILSENIDSEYPQKIFEIGKVFETKESDFAKVKGGERFREGQISKPQQRAGGYGDDRAISRVREVGGGITESEHLAAAITPGNFTELKQIIEYLSKMANIKIKLKEPEEFPPHFIEGRVAEICLVDDEKFARTNINSKFKGGSEPLGEDLGGNKRANLENTKVIGFIGEIHPKILKNWRIKMPVTLFEIDLEEILES
ncbi:phenylalanine--tRNA ligase subunit beta [Candidatus Pacearchaeota archaeon]|nr:phenylalanine--tRNA ligase subunit beta [Candidatus Pacearchaeota archaeon]